MRLRIEIDCGNDAFAAIPGREGQEVARILHDYAGKIAHDCLSMIGEGVLRDINGNTVGTVTWEGEDA